MVLFSAAVLFIATAIDAPAPLPAPAPAPLVDKNASCGGWAKAGECSKNPAYMLVTCSKSCNDATSEIMQVPGITKPEPVTKRMVPEPVRAAFEEDVVKAPALNADISEQNHQWYLQKQQQEKAKQGKTKQEKDGERVKRAELTAVRAQELAKREAGRRPNPAANSPLEKIEVEPVKSDEPYQPTTVDMSSKATAPKTKTTLLGAITASTAVKTVKKTVKKAGITLKSTLSKLHLHDERDQQDTIKAEEKKEHGEKLSWHEKALLKQQKDAKAQTLTKSKVQKNQQQKEQKEQPKKTSMQKNAAGGATYPNNQVERDQKIKEAHEQQAQTAEKEHRHSASSSVGNYLFVAVAVLFLGWFIVMSAMQTDAGKRVARNLSGLIAGARMGSKTLGKVKSGLHRAASGDAYHFA